MFLGYMLLFLAAACLLQQTNTKLVGYQDAKVELLKDSALRASMESYFHVKPSVRQWDSIDSPNKISLLSMHVDHHTENSWFIPAQHEKHSFGWNRSVAKGYLGRPYACSIRFIGVGFASTLEGFEHGGSGYLTIDFKNSEGKALYHGFDKNESNRVFCYYKTNKDTGSEFQVSSDQSVRSLSFLVLNSQQQHAAVRSTPF